MLNFVGCCLSGCHFSFGRCTVCTSIYRFWLPLWYLFKLIFKKSSIFAIYRGIKVHCIVQSLVFSVAFCRSLLFRFPFLFWPLYILFVLRFSATDYPFGILKLFLKKKLHISYVSSNKSPFKLDIDKIKPHTLFNIPGKSCFMPRLN